MLVDSFLAESAERCPEKVGLIAGSWRLTYRRMDAAANAFAAALKALGIGRGDRVVIHLENGVDSVVTIWGALRADCVFVPVNPTIKPAKLAYILSDCGAAVLISDHSGAEIVESIRGVESLRAVVTASELADASEVRRAGLEVHTLQALLGRHQGAPAPTERGIDVDLAALVYTSGSTGRAKGVMLTHANIVVAATSISSYLEMTERDTILDALPLSFDYGLYQLFLTAKVGGTVVLERAFVYPSMVLKLIDTEKVTGLPIVPMMAGLLLRQDLAAYDLSTLRFISNTGAVLPTPLVNALRQKLPHVSIFKMYGLTECKRVSYLAPSEIDARPDSVGKPMDNVEVYLVDEDGNRMDHGVGELVIRGANVMQGYWGAPEATAQVLKPGPYPGEFVLHSGDIFRIDEDGFLYFQSRIDDVIKCRGQKVSPREVEAVLLNVPGVAEAFVTGIPDPIVGVAVKAFVTLDGTHPVTEQDVLWHCARNLEDFMLPKFIAIVEQLPRTTTGKVARTTLQSPQTT